MATKAEKLLRKGRAQHRKGNLDRAFKLVCAACDEDRYEPDAWVARADIAEALGDAAGAAEAAFTLADIYARGGMRAQAMTLVDRVLALDSSHAGARAFKRMLTHRPRPAAVREPVVEADPDQAMPTAEPVSDPVPKLGAGAPEPDDAEPALAAALEAAGETDATTAIRDVGSDRIGSQRPEPVSNPGAASCDAGEGGDASSVRKAVPEAQEYRLGRATSELALDALDLGGLLGEASDEPDADAIDIDLELDDNSDVVRAVAATVTTSPLLSELDSDLVKRLIEVGRLVHRRERVVVFNEGDAGTSLFLILKGAVSVERTEDGQQRQLALLKPGAFFGEMALLTNAPRSASCIAQTKVDLLEVSRRQVRELVEHDDELLKLLMRFFRARLVGTLLATSPLFEPFSRDEKRDLITKFRLRELRPGYLIVKQGERADGLYLVLVGALQVFSGGAITNPKVLGELGPGDVFGEMSLLDGTSAMANVRTLGRSWVLLLPRTEFAALVSEQPLVLERLSLIADRRRSANEDTLAAGTAPEPAAQVKPV